MGNGLQAVCLALAMLLAATVQGVAQSYATVDLNMRAGPGKNHVPIALVPRGAPVFVHGCTTSRWCDVSFGSVRGWVYGRYIADRSYVVAAAPQVVFVRTPAAPPPHHMLRPVILVPSALYWTHAAPVAQSVQIMVPSSYVVESPIPYVGHPQLIYSAWAPTRMW